MGVLALGLAGFGVVAPAAQAEAYSGTSGKGCTAYNYTNGGYAACIGYIQKMLNGINQTYGKSYGGYGLAVDNQFGPKTKTQVQRFQKFAHLTADGIVGPKTWNQLCFYAGQVNFNYSSSGSTKNAAWSAAYNAGCKVEKATSTGIGYVTISRY
ncbi:peptidoglycan-binding domain-containing protein [Leucobacter denitrificans]|uniref:peptidoglycan-binding domain-containing protein n=1 Tax=Leucobacter denitrificans TaxID=683042 RepID=UPI001CB6F71A|nr:peptidoglycan-binding domain-containing protein [Leucobacter denitrificans]